jgi:hypothetical protein
LRDIAVAGLKGVGCVLVLLFLILVLASGLVFVAGGPNDTEGEVI